MTRTWKRAAALGAAAWATLIPVNAAMTAPVCSGTSQTFTPNAGFGSATDGAQPYAFAVPAGVSQIEITAAGAQGAQGYLNVGGLGARVQGTYVVTPGNNLCIVVGVRGGAGGGYSGGGGGGSFVFSSSGPCLLSGASVSNLLVAAGGGGGPGGNTAGLPGLAAGLGAGADGALAGGRHNAPGATGGQGGAANFGSGGGGLLSGGANGVSSLGGSSLIDGAAGGGGLSTTRGGFGGGGESSGGGGGYNGGGGGYAAHDEPAGGGGSFSAVVPNSAQDGVQADNGLVTLCYTPPPPAPVPTLSEWAMIGLTALLALLGLTLIDRRRRPAR